MKTSFPKLHSIKYKDHENVEVLRLMTRHDLPVDRVLMAALNEKLTNVVIIGEYADGSTYHAATNANMGEIFLAMEQMKKHLLDLLE